MKRVLPLFALLGLCGACRKPAPVAAPGRLAEAVRQARNLGNCAAIVPQEWPAGWPVPSPAPGGARFNLFFYPLGGTPDEGPRMSEPAADAALDLSAGPTASCRTRTGTRKELKGARWTEAAERLDSDAFDAQAERLYALTEAAGAAFAAGRSQPSAADAAAAREYFTLFETLAEPPLLAEYYRLNPRFWEWVRIAAGRSIPKS
jgi:hypothetical protein